MFVNETYYSTKKYDHSEGLSAVFRQPNAQHSHCKFLHGYSLSFKFTFACSTLDDKNWAVDFGGLKELKKWLHDNFDHKVILDAADPELEMFDPLVEKGLAEVVVMEGVGAEKFAQHAFNKANKLVRSVSDGRCYCVEVEVAEHSSNSAIYRRDGRSGNGALANV